MNFKRGSGKGILLLLALVILLSTSVIAADEISLTATAIGGNDVEVDLTWNNGALTTCNVVDYYRIERDGVLISQQSSTTFTDSDLTSGTNYSYEVFAYNTSGGSYQLCADSTLENATPEDTTAPESITYLDVMDYPSDDGTQILINWGHSPDYEADDDDYMYYYFINKYEQDGCSGLSNPVNHSVYRSEQTNTYTWDELIPGETYSFTMRVYDISGNYVGSFCDNATATDNSGPAPPQNPDAADVEDDQGEEGISLTWEASPDQGSGSQDVSMYKYYSRYTAIGDYTNFGNVSVSSGSQNQTYWEYSSEYDGAFDSRVVAEYLGLYVPPFDDGTFYFYITAYDDTFETQSIIVNERFNAEPTIEDIRLFPNQNTAQTSDDLSCVAFVCELNEDDTLTAETEFGVTHFYNATGGEIVNKNASCTNLGQLVNGVIPQYPYINVDCYNDNGESGNVWECISNLENEYTFMADKITCEMTVSDEMEAGETKTYNEFHGIYPINNTAPTASDVEISPSNPEGDDTLTCDFEFNDIDGNEESVAGSAYAIEHNTYTTYRWYINNEGLNDYLLIPGKNSSTLDEYFDQNDYVKCAVNPCDKDLSWVNNPLCQGEGVEGSQGKEYWILEGDECAGYMECGLMDETQCTYAENENWGCEWDADYLEATPATIYGSKVLTDCSIIPSPSTNDTIELTVNGQECQLNLSGLAQCNITAAAAYINGKCGLSASNVTIDSYPDYTFNTLKIYTSSTGADQSILVTGGTALDTFGFEVGDADVGTDVDGWCIGDTNTTCRDLDASECANENVSLSNGGFCYSVGDVLTFTNSTPTIIGGNSIPQIISYQDDSTEDEPTNVGSEMIFNATWVDTDPNELGKLIVCPLTGGTEDYSCDAESCSDNLTFGDYGNTAWAYTNETSMLIETIEIKASSALINGTAYGDGESTPFIFSIIAFEADNNSMGDNPTSSLEGYYEDETVIIARSDWNPVTVGEWSTFTLQYNAQPLEGKYTGLKLCVADPEEPGISGGGTGYAVSGATYTDVYTGDNWFGKIIFEIGKFFRTFFSFTGRATTSYNDNCLTLGELHPDYANSSVNVAANSSSTTGTLIYDDTDNTGGPWYNKADIRINYLSSTGTGGSCPGSKTYCETDLSLDRDVGCTYEAEDEDDTITQYHMRICDDENSCSIWREGYFYVNHLPYVDWVTIGTNHLSYEEGLTYTSDVNDDWNLQCIRSIAHDGDLSASSTSSIIIDADGWTTVFQNQDEKDTNLVNGSTLKTCNNTGLYYVDVNGDGDYDYKIDTLAFNDSGTEHLLLQFSNESTGDYGYFNVSADSYCYYHDTNSDDTYDNGEDIIWDSYSSGSTTIYNETITYEYEWFVKPYGSDEFSSCSDFLWCDNNGNDILAHGNTEPGDEWLCEVTPIDWRGVGEGKNSSILHVTAGTGGTQPGQGGPEITYVSHNYDIDNPAIVGQDATISIGWDGDYDYVKLYLCDGNSPYIRNSGCWGYEFNRTTTSASPINAVFELEEGAYVYDVENHGPVNYTVILCSEDYDCSNSSDSFYINHLPEVDDLDLLYYDGSGYVSGVSTNETQALNCSASIEDIDNDISAYTYEWYVKRNDVWQLYWQEESVIPSAVLSSAATLAGDIWRCDLTPEDAYSTGTTAESNTISITSSGGTESNSTVLNVIDDASKIFPKNEGENITFNVYWQNEEATNVVVYVCDSPNVLKTGCPAGSTQYGYSGWTTSNPVVLKYELDEDDYANSNLTKGYYTRVCDNNFDCSDVFYNENTTIGINHLPYALDIVMINETNGTYLNVSNNITCNYSFSDMDNSLYNSLGYNTSLYREEADTDFAWYRYVSGSWVEQTSYTSQVLPSSATSLGDRWKCGIVVNDGYTDGPETFSSFRVIGGNGPIIESLTSNAEDDDDPLTKGDTLVFTVDWYDPQQENDEQIDLYICNDYDVSQGSGCGNETFCEVENTYMDPINCSMSSSDFDYFNTTFVATIYDLNGSMAQYNGSIYINNEPTLIGNVSLLGAGTSSVYPIASENLICSAEGNDTDNNTGLDYYYYWYRDNGSGFQQYTYPNTASTMLSQYTTIGDTWKCAVTICDEYACTDNLESNTVYLTQYGTNETPSVLSISVDSTYDEPTNVGDPVIFSINWTDADLAEGEYVRAFICNSSDIIENAGCVDKTFAQTDFTSSIPLTASYTVDSAENGNTTAYIILCDDEEVCSEQSNVSFYVNHVPEAQNVNVTNSTNGNYFDENTFLNCSYDFYDADENFSYQSQYNSSSGSYFFWYKYEGGGWVDQDMNVQILPSTYTSLGEAWKCGIVVSDAYATNNEVLSEPIAIGNINPVIENVTINSEYNDPVEYGEDADFIIEWFDATTSEEVDIFVCNSAGHNRYGCTGITLCALSSTSTSPYECSYDTSGLSTSIMNQSYYVYIYDSTELNGSYNSSSHSNNLYINHPPSITSVNLTGESGNLFPTTDEDLICNNSVIADVDDASITSDYNDTSMIYTWYLDQGAGFVEYPYSGQVLTSWHTLEGEYWKCTATPTDGYHAGTGINSQIRYIYGDNVSEVPEISYVSVNSNTSYPTKEGQGVVFTINWLDSDQPFGEEVNVYVCRTEQRYNDGGCVSPYIESYGVSSNPIIINYTALATDYSNSTYYIQLEDSEGNTSEWYNGENNTFAVNHRPNVTSLQTAQTDEDTLECQFTYLESNYGGSRDDSDIANNYSSENSWFKWYKYDSTWQEITTADEHSAYLTSGFDVGDLIKCKVMVGDEWGLTDTQYRDGGSIEVMPAPEIPIVWNISGTTNTNNVSVIGYIDETDLTDLSAQVYSWQGYQVPKINSTSSLVSSALMGTSTIIDDFSSGSSYVVINGNQQSQFTAGRYVEFSNHDRTYFKRYEISSKVEIIPNTQYRINLVDTLDDAVSSGTTITVHTAQYPNGWFNISEFVLHSGANNIGVRAVRDIDTGNLSSNFTDTMLVVYDNIKPNIDAADVLGYATSNQPLLEFSVTDNYLLNISTLVLNLTDSDSNSTYYLMNDTPYSYTPTGSNIACEHVSSEVYNCNVLVYVPDGSYTLNWSVYDNAGNYNTTQISGYMVNATQPVRPTVTRTQAEYNITNLTYNISIPTELYEGADEALIQFAIGTNYYPYSGWDSVMNWTNITDFDTTNEYIYYSDISNGHTYLNLSTGNLSLIPHTIYIVNARYRMKNWTRWSPVGFTQAMKYFPPYQQGEGPSSVNVTAPPYSFSPYITVNWTEAEDASYGISHYIIAAGTSAYPDTGWNNTLEWAYAGTGLSKIMDMNSMLEHLQDYYFTVAAISNIGIMGTPSSSYGTTYYDQIPPIVSVVSVANDTESYDGWEDTVNDGQTLVEIAGDELMSCYYSPYDKDFQDYNSATDGYCDNSLASPKINMTCNIPAEGQGEFDYHILCQDTMSPQPNKQNRSQNTDFNVTLDWPDNPEVEPSITIYNNTLAANSVDGREYALDDDLLRCTYVYSDEDGNSTVIDSLTERQWLVNSIATGEEDEYVVVSTIAEEGDTVICQVKVYDVTGRTSGWTSSDGVYVNNSGPTTPEIIVPVEGVYYKNIIRFNWTDSVDADEESVEYWIHVYNPSEEDIANISTSYSYWNKNISDREIWVDGNYSVYVSACDDEICSDTDEVDFGVDYTAPSVVIDSPSNNSIKGIYFDLYANISDSLSGLDDYWYNVTNSSGDNVRSGMLVLLGGQYYAQVVTAGLETGNYTVTAYATDEVSNENSSSITLRLDLDSANMVVDPDDWEFREQWLRDTLSMDFEVNQTGTIYSGDTENNVTLSYVMKYQDGTIKKINSTINDSTFFTWNQSFNTTGWVEGRYDIVVSAKDYWNNTNTVNTWFMVDRSAPTYENMNYLPSSVYDYNDVNLSIDLLNNVFIWNANENNIDKNETYFQYNKTGAARLINLTIPDGNLSYYGDNFYAEIPEGYSDAEEEITWRVIAYDLAGNQLVTPWQTIEIASTPPEFSGEIDDITWAEDTSDTSLDLEDYFSDLDGDTLTYSSMILPKGTLLYESFDNESDIIANNGSYENIEIESGQNNYSMLIQSEVNNLLSNGNFSDYSYDEEYIEVPTDWTRHSYPTYSHSGPPYVIVDEHDYYTQAVSVDAQETYTLSMYMRNYSTPGYGRMYVNWFNSLYPSDTTANKTLSYIGSTMDCSEPYNCTGLIYLNETTTLNESRKTLTLDSPSGAAYAEIVLSTDSDSVSAQIAEVQFEEKEYASVFYNGHRLPGVLSYPVARDGRDRIELSEGTIAMFVKPVWDSNYTALEDNVFFNLRESNVDVFKFEVSDEELIFSLMDGAYSITKDISDWEADEWHFIAATWNANGLSITVDDDTDTSSASVSFGSMDISDSDIYVGSDSDGELQANCYVDDFAVFDYAKSASELNDFYTNNDTSYIEEPITISTATNDVVLTPYTDYFGEQRAFFYAEDDYTKVSSNLVNLNVTPVDDTPRFNSSNQIDNQSWWVNQNKSIDLSDVLYDVDGSGVLVYSINFTDGSGNLSLEYSGTTITLIPDADWTGTEEISIIGSDGNSANVSNAFNATVYFNWLNETYVEGTYYANNYSTALTEIYQTEAYLSNITDISNADIINSYIYNSNISNSNITNSNVTNSTLADINLVNAVVVNAYIDPSTVTNSSIIGDTRIIDSTVLNSLVDNSNITNSYIYNWVVRDANITDDQICWGTIYNRDETELLYSKTANGSCDYLPDLVNYDPLISSLSVSIDDTSDVASAQFVISDQNFGSALDDNVTYTIDWGDGSDTTGSVTSQTSFLTSPRTSSPYTASGTYSVVITLEDSYDGEDVETRSISVTVASSGDTGDSGDTGGGSSGGGSSGGSSSRNDDDDDDEEDEEESSSYVGQATSTVSATCYDGIKNQGEEGVDCGGPCAPCVVQATCYDGIKNQGEEGVDCGGPCSACSTLTEDEGSLVPYLIGLVILLILLILFIYLMPKKKKLIVREPVKELKPVARKQEVIKTDIPHISASTTDVFAALRAYISARLRQGYGKNHIKETLMLRGWPEEVVDVALDGSNELEGKLEEVEGYIRDSFAAGYKLKQIKSALMEQGWSEGITDLLLFEVHRPSGNRKHLREYIDYKIMQGKNMNEIKQILRTVGWKEEVIDSILR